MIIRQAFYKKIISTINEHKRFENTDFEIKADQPKNVTLRITYLADPKYYIYFDLPKSQSPENGALGLPVLDYSFTGMVCPGPMALTESYNFRGEDGIFKRITTWLNCIWEELSSNPIVKQLEDQQQQIEEILKQFDAISDDFFTKAEAYDLKKRLDAMEEMLKANIQQQNEDGTNYKDQIDKLHIDIDTLKITIDSLKKKGWIKNFVNKSWKWGLNSENRKMLKDTYSVVKAFLPENIKTNLPE